MHSLGPFDPDLLDALERASEKPFEGLVWRAVVGTTDPLRANTLGGRWNPPGVEALYCSTSPQGAEAELRYLLSRQPVPTSKPISVVQIRVRLTRATWVPEESFLTSTNLTVGALTEGDWHLPNLIGAAADWLKLPGLLVPSARHANLNLVILVNNLSADDSFDLVR